MLGRKPLNKSALIVALPSVFFLLFSVFGFTPLAQAEPVPGLAVTVYNNYGYNGSPPLPSVSGRPVQCTLTYPNINQDFGANICGLSDDYIVKYEGYITSPETQTITFYPYADDGTKLYVDNVLIDNNWVDKGGGGNPSSPVSFTAGVPKPITLWFYENGGGNSVTLYWDLDDGFEIVPAEAFTQNDETSYTTTTTTTTTTVPPTTTTTLAPYFNAVQNLTAVANIDGSVALDWDAPEASNIAPYMYSVGFSDLDPVGGGWGVWTLASNTSYTLSTGMFSGTNPVTTGYGLVRFTVYAGSGQCVGVGAGDCTYGAQASVDVTVLDPTPPTTTTTTTSTTTTTTSTTVPTTTTSSTTIYVEPGTTTTSVYSPETTVPEPESTTTTLPEDEEETESTTTSTIPQEVDEEEEQDPPAETAPPLETEKPEDLPSENTIPIELDEINEDVTEEELAEVLESIFTPDSGAEEVAEALEGILESDLTDEQFGQVMDTVFADISDTEQTTEVLSGLLDQDLTGDELASVMEAVFSEDASVSEMGDVVGSLLEQDLSQDELSAVFDAVFDGDLSDAETISLIVDILSDDLEASELGAALGAVFDDEVTDEVLVETFTAVLGTEINADSVGVIVDVLESESINNEQVALVVTLIIEQEGGIDEEQATELATSAKVLESIDGEQATEVFDAIVASEVTQEAGLEIVAALASAGEEVKEAFQEEINVFAGVFDTYVAIDSTIDVGDRRTVIAVGAAVAVAGAIGASGGASGGSGSPSGGQTGPTGTNDAARKEEEQEPSGEISADGLDWIKGISIFIYKEGVRFMNWKAFFKKFSYGIMNMGFTIAGSLVVYLTLSGSIQRIAGISTVFAFAAAMYLHMKEPSDQ